MDERMLLRLVFSTPPYSAGYFHLVAVNDLWTLGDAKPGEGRCCCWGEFLGKPPSTKPKDGNFQMELAVLK